MNNTSRNQCDLPVTTINFPNTFSGEDERIAHWKWRPFLGRWIIVMLKSGWDNKSPDDSIVHLKGTFKRGDSFRSDKSVYRKGEMMEIHQRRSKLATHERDGWTWSKRKIVTIPRSRRAHPKMNTKLKHMKGNQTLKGKNIWEKLNDWNWTRAPDKEHYKFYTVRACTAGNHLQEGWPPREAPRDSLPQKRWIKKCCQRWQQKR
jgi:hypothetical protein